MLFPLESAFAEKGKLRLATAGPSGWFGVSYYSVLFCFKLANIATMSLNH